MHDSHLTEVDDLMNLFASSMEGEIEEHYSITEQMNGETAFEEDW